MKVKCIGNSGNDLSSITLASGHLQTTKFSLKIEEIYMVYGISVWKGIIHYLTMDKFNTVPSWYPAELFIIIDNLLPIEWYYKYFNSNKYFDVSALWGYKELVLDENHYDDLIERKAEAITVFLNRKKEIDEYMD